MLVVHIIMMNKRYEERLNLLNDFINSTKLDSENKAVLENFSYHLQEFFRHLSDCIGNTKLSDDEAYIVEDMCLYSVKLTVYPRNPVSKDLREAEKSLKKENMIQTFLDLIKRHRKAIISDLHKVKYINEGLYDQIIFKWDKDHLK